MIVHSCIPNVSARAQFLMTLNLNIFKEKITRQKIALARTPPPHTLPGVYVVYERGGIEKSRTPMTGMRHNALKQIFTKNINVKYTE